MFRLKYFLLCGLVLLLPLQIAHGQISNPSVDSFGSAARVDRLVTVCPASKRDTAPPTKTDPKCQSMRLENANPQGHHIWVLLNIKIPDTMLDSFEPLGIGLSAKASSFIYINGREVARNGRPADQNANELIGRMDVVFPLREGTLKAGDNEIALRLSSHSGYLKLDMPIHSVYVSDYEQPQSRILRRYSSSLLPFGIFVLGALYFLTMSVVGRSRLQSALLAFMSAIIACQLFAEVSRGLFAYLYPWHDIRLLAIVSCSALFGIGLSLYVARMFGYAHFGRWCALIAVTAALAMFIPAGYDAKAIILLLSQTVLSLGITLFYGLRNPVKTVAFSTVLLIFAIVNFFGQGQFLDIYFFYSIAVLMLFLFVQQALAYGQEQALRQEEKIRANKLQLVLDQHKDKNQSAILSLTEAGKIHRVAADDIIFISGANDYIEVRLESGKTRFVSSTLADIEAELPSFFLRVHRSHIVNTNFIESLNREPSGTGALILTQGDTLPVSRRIMPSVRKALI
jgi:hypothetical protein